MNMHFKTLTAAEADAKWVPSSLQFGTDLNYDDLILCLGEPTYPQGDGYKVDAEWVIEFQNKKVTIYNYKDGINYNGIVNGKHVRDIKNWHIGGEDFSTSNFFIYQLKNLINDAHSIAGLSAEEISTIK